MHEASFSLAPNRPRVAPLYRVPNRCAPLRRHIPPGRTLHVIDIENLMGGPKSGVVTVRIASAQYRERFPIQSEDLVVVAANPALAIDVWQEWKGSQIRLRAGANGADLALLDYLADPYEIMLRFDRVMLGSGDGIFAPIVRRIRSEGIAVGVVGRSNGISRILARSATFVAAIDRDWLTEDAA